MMCSADTANLKQKFLHSTAVATTRASQSAAAEHRCSSNSSSEAHKQISFNNENDSKIRRLAAREKHSLVENDLSGEENRHIVTRKHDRIRTRSSLAVLEEHEKHYLAQLALANSTLPEMNNGNKNEAASSTMAAARMFLMPRLTKELLILTYKSKEKIAVIKKRDPIFAKRYKQLISARIKNQAPNFDRNDHAIPDTLTRSKSVMKRHKNEIIKRTSMHDTRTSNFKAKVEQVDAKVKDYLSNFNFSSW